MNFLLRLIFVALLLSPWSPAADSPTAMLKGSVTDSSGGAIGQARLLIHWDPSGSKVGLTTNIGLPNDLWIETDRTGDFSAEIPPGFYDIFITYRAFAPDCHKICLRPGETAIYNAKLNADPIVIKELGFFIPDAR